MITYTIEIKRSFHIVQNRDPMALFICIIALRKGFLKEITDQALQTLEKIASEGKLFEDE